MARLPSHRHPRIYAVMGGVTVTAGRFTVTKFMKYVKPVSHLLSDILEAILDDAASRRRRGEVNDAEGTAAYVRKILYTVAPVAWREGIDASDSPEILQFKRDLDAIMERGLALKRDLAISQAGLECAQAQKVFSDARCKCLLEIAMAFKDETQWELGGIIERGISLGILWPWERDLFIPPGERC